MQQRHGSGKTTVLVERIINKIINEKIDIDKLLIVTFTNAAASEMRQRILDAIYEKLEKDPDNKNMQRQIVLLNKANISTIHAFCLEIIKNYFYEIGIQSNFRIGDNSEVEILKMETLEDLFEELYEKADSEFLNLTNTYAGYRDDEALKELVLKIYNYSQSMPFPEEWIKQNVQKFNLSNKINEDFSKTIWGELLIDYFNEEISSCVMELEEISKELKNNADLGKYYFTIQEDLQNLKLMVASDEWDYIYNNLINLKFSTWPRQAKTDCELKDYCKQIRDSIKERIKVFTKKIFIYSSEEANKDIYEMYPILKELETVILEFSKKYQENKKERNIIDFSDIEHYALKILVRKNEEGLYEASNIAKEYQEKFKEIAIDEYQDSNLVQEYILNTISKNNNIFMVGDVKQSIYKFRGARPELFLEKYNDYILAEDDESNCAFNTKIKLYQNFRSRKNVLDITNMIFENIMNKKVGDIDYTSEEYLNCGAEYKEPENKEMNVGGNAELNIIDFAEDLEDEETDFNIIEKKEIEAKFVAKKINDLVNSNYYVYDKKSGYRHITYKDIVILLRTTSNVAPEYEKELKKLEIPVFSDTGLNYFETEEIQIILSVLKIIDNPNNDIPLVTVLRSPIVGLSDNELVEVRLESKNTSYYEALLEIAKSNTESDLKNKIIDFLNTLDEWKQKQEYLALNELIWYIMTSTNYYDFVNSSKNGDIKTANLRFLFEKARDYEKASFKGLYNFINYIEKIGKSSGDMGSAKLIGENEDVVRIMSIHKSKGLEFPVVFLCGTGKQFNVQDLNENILLHQDIGFGPKYINYERKIEYDTLAKEAIKVKSLNEILSEEMRLLYVALTRAKEKLIITGCDKDLKKSLKDKEKLFLSSNQGKINVASIKKAKSYLQWLELIYLKNEDKLNRILKIKVYNKKDILSQDEEKACNKKPYNIEIEDEELLEKVSKLLNWKYSYVESTKTQGKTSVTDIAKKNTKNNKTIILKPKFLSNTEKLSNTEIGTLMHLVLQKLDFNKIYNEKLILELIQNLIEKKLVTENEAKYINIEKILKFTKSKLYNEIRNAKEIYKEQPFYIYLSSDEIYNNKMDDKILVQGIIDLYFVDKSDNIVLVDYKTDYIQNNCEQELINKYKEQLDLYKRALEQGLNKKVKEVYIYSIYLNKEIVIV